ncbi:MAG: glycosyltransferase family 39 protein [Anaerolineae bacterium]|nr:glycosyltransferase family 39 protein [Anaerolineae bacterium]
MDSPRGDVRGLGLAVILIVYVLTAGLYALRTPLWQNPDEPAHFNYIRYIWEEQQLPVLQMGDYPHAYLEDIKARRFPPDMSIAPIRYEFHQPPLYYLIAAPVYGLAGSIPLTTGAQGVIAALGAPTKWGWPLPAQVMALRFLSIAFGVGFLVICYRLAHLIFPDDHLLALLATGFAATIPMHVAMSAAVNNDSLANLLLALAVLLMLKAMRAEGSRAVRTWVWTGVVAGLAMLAKSSTYVAIPLALAAIAMTPGRSARSLAVRAVMVFGPALALNLPWYIRNAVVYGGVDVLGLQRHGEIVLGQPTTAEWVARMGRGGLAREFIATTFRSFWAQFGWMGVLVDQRIYQALALVSLLAVAGLCLFLLRAAANRGMLSGFRWKALGLLALWLGLTGAAYLWYNAQFVQHQGRYLFPAMPAIALGMALGVRETFRPTRARFLALVSALGIAASLAMVAFTGRAFKTLSLLLGLSALGYVVIWWLGPRRSWIWHVAAYALFVALDFICLFGYIVPYFTG